MKITVEFESINNEPDERCENRLISSLRKITTLKYKVINTIPSSEITFDSIEKSVCEHVKCEPEELQRRTRKREVVEARQICHYLARNNHLGSLASIGFRFGEKDHATVLHSNKTVLNLLQTNLKFKELHESFIQSFDHEKNL